MTASASASSGAVAGPHLLVLPFPAQGHIIPLLHLCHRLALHGLSLTLVVTPLNRPILAPLLSSHPASVRTLLLPFPPHPSLPTAVENVSQLGNRGAASFIAALSSLADPIADWFSSHPSPPLAILSDFFMGWTVSLAARLSVPRIAFFTSGPFFASIYDRLWRLHNSADARSLPIISFPDLPRSPSLPRHHLPSTFLRYRESDPDFQTVRECMLANGSSWGCVFNTFEAIEGEYMEHLRAERYGGGRVYGVGPLSLTTEDGLRVDLGTGTGPDPMADAATAWLDGCPDGSVLYVCFGSQKLLSGAQMEAVGSALERCGRRFVWVVKPGTAEQRAEGIGAVPPGLEERVAGRGVVVSGWAPQVAMLNHRAVGWFLSHCGWNSALEAMGAGVAVLGWPMEAEQFVNARLMADHLGAAAVVWEGADAVPDAAALGSRIGEAMRGGGELRAAAERLRDAAVEAVGRGGSSRVDIEALVGDLGRLKIQLAEDGA